MKNQKSEEENFFIDEGEETIEDSEYSVKGDFSKAELVQKQLARCMELRSKDMRPGYTTYIMGKPEIIPDSRKEYVGSVEVLKNTLAPEISSKMPELPDIWDAEKKKIFDKYAYHERVGRKWIDNKATWVYSDRIYIPQKGSLIMTYSDKPLSINVSYSTTEWDSKIDAYWDEMVFISDDLYAELNILIHELDYFKGKAAW